MSWNLKIIMFRIFYISLSFVALLGICEIYLRFQRIYEREQLAHKYAGRELTFVRSKDQGLIYEFIPNKNGTNSHGYMDSEHSYEKPKGIFRIVIIGDSIAQGQGVSPKDSFGRVMERSLNQGAAKNHYEVVILARSGYTTSQELILLHKEAFRYQPDLIVWSYVLNDPAHPVYHNANGELGLYFYEPISHALNFVSKTLFLAAERWKGRNCPKEFHKFIHCVHWEQVRANVMKLGEIPKRKKTPVVFIIHPVFQKGKNFSEYTLLELHRKLRELSFQAGLIPVDLFDAYRDYEPDQIKQHSKDWYDTWHPNAKGHQIIGDYLVEKLRTGGSLDGKDFAEGR